MTGNTELWDKLGRTDPSHTKQFKRAGGFSGTAIKPMWAYKRMTEEFGPCGKGWGIGEPSFQVVPGPEGEVLVYCTASIWYVAADESGPHTVFGVGGDKAVGKNKYGLTGDDEAFKKAFTDAITNALKMIGVGADVHMGMFDDNKYVNDLRNEFDGKKEDYKPSLPKKDARPLYSELEKSMRACTTKAELSDWYKRDETKEARAKLPADWQNTLKQAAADFGRGLPEGHAEDDTVSEIKNQFPGARVTGDRPVSTLEAG